MNKFEFSYTEKTEIIFENEAGKLFDGEKVVIFLDNNLSDVFDAYLQKRYFSKCNIISNHKVVVNEKIKSIEFVSEILKKVGDIDRDTIFISIGGGALGDVTGFIASITLRGCRYINFPSSLLAMVDSCFGGKTALNFSGIKNYIGSFKNPEKIIFDLKLLDSLPDDNYLDGFAEIIKYGAIYKPDILINLQDNVGVFKHRNYNELRQIIKQSIKVKYHFVSNDLYDKDKRRILNFGHSFAHAIESLSNNEITHGQAVAVGMLMAARYSYEEKFCGQVDVEKLEEVVRLFFDLETLCKKIKSFNMEKLISYMYNDKKKIGKKINLILMKKLGNCFIYQVNDARKIESFCKKFIQIN